MKHTRQDLNIMQGWSLEEKIKVSQMKILEWYRAYSGQVFTSFSGGKDSTVLLIKVFNQAGSTFEKMKQTVTYFKDFTLAWYRHNWPYTAAYSVILPSAIVGVLPVGVVLLNRGEIVFPTLLLFVLLSFALIPPLIKLTEFIDNVAVIVKTEQEVQDFLAQEEPRYAITPARIENFGISIEHISFSYGEETAVEDINVVIPPSGITAIVGESGSGKTTLLRLLARFWDVSKGKIYIGGTDIRDIPQDQLMGMMSIVDQDNFLFDMSIRDNIMLGKPDADDKALAASVDAAGCREIVERLEGGLHTVVGTGGALLSTGERQRICIARAILKDAPILLLDEPTASMDLENEYKVQKALQQLMSPKTVVMATHRLRTAVSAQQILVMKHGVLVGKGTHETLLEGCPEYARLWNACVCAENWSISFEGVSFSYGKGEVLKNLSFHIPEHSTAALVGRSGSGKSTVMKLIPRFYDCGRGSVRIGNVDIRDMPRSQVFSYISMVFQNVYLFEDTIANNIRFGKPEASMEDVIEAARKAHCYDFIMKTEKGFDTMVGEGGHTLSGGQKQRISIARAILKDAPIILLDEATSSVDPENEHLIQQAINQLVKNKTVVVIAHNLSAIRTVDKVLVLDEGQLLEEGDPSSLLQKKGLYSKLWGMSEKVSRWNAT